MRYFKSPEGTVFAYSDIQEPRSGLVEMSAAEIAELWATPLHALIDQKRAEIEAWRDAEEHAAIVFTHAGREWDGGLRVRQRLQPVIALPELPEGFFWTDHANEDVPMTVTDVFALNAAHEMAIVVRGFAIHARQRAMKEELAGLTDPAEVANYVVGWPE